MKDREKQIYTDKCSAGRLRGKVLAMVHYMTDDEIKILYEILIESGQDAELAERRAKADRGLSPGESVVEQFAADCCTIIAGNTGIWKDELYNAYCAWCEERQTRPLNRIHFGRGLLKLFRQHVVAKRIRRNNESYWIYQGITLTGPAFDRYV